MQKLLGKIAAFAMVMAMTLTFVPLCAMAEADDSALSTNVTVPFHKDITYSFSDGTTTKSNSYRIPSMVTLNDGTIVAASDIRWNTTYDGGGLDTIVARSSDGGVSWDYSIANYLGDNGNEYNGSSTCFIDPCLTVAEDGKTLYMLCDLYPYGVALNGEKETAPSTKVGFDSNDNLLLRANNHSSYDYYLKDGNIYSTNGTAVSGYTVDDHFNLYYNGEYKSNLFFADSPYKVVRTGFLYLTKSTDGGATWSEPTLLNLKTSSEQVCLVGPGRGITTADGTMVFPVYSYSGTTEGQKMGFVYSTDEGKTWQRSDGCGVSWSSEAAVVEVGTGTLRFFYRCDAKKLCYIDYDMSAKKWGSAVTTSVVTNSDTQLSAITYSKTSDGKQVILVSCPTGPNAKGSDNNDGSCRLNGRIFTGVVNADKTMTWNSDSINVNGVDAKDTDGSMPYTEEEGFFAYSCLTERADGSVAVLYENQQNGWGYGSDKYFTMNMKAYDASALGLTFDSSESGGEEGGDVVVPDVPAGVVSANGVTISSDNVTFTGLTAESVTPPTADYIKKAIAFDVTPYTANGAYTGSARVTMTIPENWNASNVFGYVKESNGDLTVLAGTASADGTFTYTTPHFSETGIFEATSRAAVNSTTVTLEIGKISDPIVVSSTANVGTQGTFTTTDGAVRYTVTYIDQPGATNNEKMDSLKDGDQIVISDGNGNYLKRNNNSISSESSISEATVWRVYGSNNSWTIVDESGSTDYYLRPGSNKLSVNSSAGSFKWSYNDNGFNYANIYYLCYQNSSWTMARRNISGYGAAYTVTQSEAEKSTSVTFTGLDVTDGTEVTIGEGANAVTYNVIVKAKAVTKPVSLLTDDSDTLDALADLKFSGSDYEVTYATDSELVDVDEDGNITSGAMDGIATVTATVKNASGKTVGTVTYNITVSAIKVNGTKNVYVPVNDIAEISNLSGDVYDNMFDTSLATYTYKNGVLTLTGVKSSETYTPIVVGTTQYNVYVVPKNTMSGTTIKKYIDITVDQLDNVTVYYAINAGHLYKIEKPGVLIDQTYMDGFNIMFFAVPDEGYALTHMGATNSNDQYYSLSNGVRADGSDSAAWPFDNPDQSTIPNSDSHSDWVEGHGFRWGLLQGNMDIPGMRDLFTRALVLGADGTNTFTKNSTNDDLVTNLSFKAEKLPTLEKEIIGYKRAGELKEGDTENENLNINGYTDYYKYDEDVTLEFGDTLLYQFIVNSYSTNVIYTNIELTDSKINYIQEITDGTFNTKGVNNYYAQYVITTNDINNYVGGKFVNDAQLKYSYSSKYSSGVYGGEASDEATCEIIGVVSYAWVEGTPEGIVNDTTTYGLPNSERVIVGGKFGIKEYQGSRSYTDKNGVKWVYTNEWGVKQNQDGNEVWFEVTPEILKAEYTMNKSRSITFYGRWKEEDKYTVTYSWSGDAPQSKTPPTGDQYYEGEQYTVDNTYKVGDVVTEDGIKYTFQGWKLNGEGGILNGQQQTMGTTDVTYYGSWTKTANTASLTISKSISGGGTADSDQSFLFNVKGEGVDLTVSVKAGGSVTIDGLTVGKTYTITELTDWSWRYNLQSITGGNTTEGNSVTKTIEANSTNTVTFTNALDTDSSWLGDESYARNIWKNGKFERENTIPAGNGNS